MQTLNFDTIRLLDGGNGAKVIDAQINEAVRDLEERAAEEKKKKKRVITFKLILEMNDASEIEVTLKGATKNPDRSTEVTRGKIVYGQSGPQVVFNQHSPERTDQRTILDEIEPDPAEVEA